ncbi:hypothetical protein IW150_003429, partial [Coemansia sp. RSA 2607]
MAAGSSSNGGSPGPADKARKSAGPPQSPVTGGSVGSSVGAKSKKDGGAASSSEIVLSPAMIEQMHEIINNHAVLKRDADNNVPFTNHLLDLVPTPPEFAAPHTVNTSQATSFISTEAGKIRAHLGVVQQTVGSVADPDAKRRLEKEIDMLEQHIRRVNMFMRSSFHSALSGNPATQTAFGKSAPAGKRAISGVVSPMTPGVLAKAPAPTSGSRPQTPVQSNSTRVAMSSALAHVAQQSTRAHAPVDPDQGKTPGSRILSKRKIQELVGEIDPLERLEPAVEDILCDIADEFIESVTA